MEREGEAETERKEGEMEKWREGRKEGGSKGGREGDTAFRVRLSTLNKQCLALLFYTVILTYTVLQESS